MKHIIMAALALLLAATGSALAPRHAASQVGGWVTLLDGKAQKMGEWDRIGDANWRLEGDAVVADKLIGKETAYLVTKSSYRDFEIRAEFWADDDCNSGIFIRMTNPKQASSKTSYEVNIFDKRPGPEYGTGAIVNVATVSPMPKAGGKWNVMEISAKGPRLIVKLNGAETVNVEDKNFAEGPFSLQYGKGIIKWRKVEVRPL